MQALPIFYFPTTIVCIDDDSIFLDELKTILDTKYNVITFNNSKQALSELKNYTSPVAKVSFLQSLVEHEYYDAPNHAPINLDMNYLHKLSQLVDRTQEISMLIIDYHMPEMDGMELCVKLYDTQFKKILLTGFVDQHRAINAFNNKLIDGFITKSDINLLKSLTDSIKLLENQYFVELTATLRNNLEISHALPLSDPIFIRFFNNWIKENDIKEYYLIDKNGSFLTIDKHDKPSYFIVHTDYSLNSLIQLYQEDKQLASFMSDIGGRQKIPFFGQNVRVEEVAPTLWGNYLYSPNILEGREHYYWCSVAAG
jgi:CheY-like chemotaxis protein